jgi:FHS family L-fucose permease-like MFS transporter
MNNSNHTKSSLALLISVFFFWGFVAASNTVLIPVFKKHFMLLQWQSQLVDFAFYISYTVGSLIYFVVSVFTGDPLNKIGYKKGLVLGLTISAVGAMGFVPSAALQSFSLMLSSLFIVGLGFALQQIVANPYMAAIGDPATGSHRISLGGGVNSFGTAIGPLLLGYAIFGSLQGTGDVGLETIEKPYIILAATFLFFALILGLSKLPAITHPEKMERDMGALKYPQLVFGMVAIFVYVGVEVSIQSNMPELMRQPHILGLESSQTVHFVSLFWGSLMIGRWTGAITVFNLTNRMKQLFTALVPLIAYAVIVGVNYIKLSAAGQNDKMMDLFYYFPFVLILIAGFFLAQERPAFTMMLFSAMAGVLMIIGLLSSGRIALYSFVSGGLFCSVMWPCIFSLSIAGLGKYTNQGSSLLVMMIAGGAIIPPLQGYISDLCTIHFSYIVPVLCYCYLFFYGWKVKRVLLNQGIDYDGSVRIPH